MRRMERRNYDDTAREKKKKKFFFSEGPPAVPLKSYTMLYNKMWRGEKISTSLGEGKISVCVCLMNSLSMLSKY